MVVALAAIVVIAVGLGRWRAPVQVVTAPDDVPQAVAVVPTSALWSAEALAAQRVRASTIEQARRVGMGTAMSAVAVAVSDFMREDRVYEPVHAELGLGEPADGSSTVVHEADTGPGAIRSSTRTEQTQDGDGSF